MGGFTGVVKINILDGKRYEIVVNSCFQDLEGGVGLKSVWEFVPEVGEKKRNERVKVAVIHDIGSFTIRGFLADLEHPEGI